MQSVSDAQLQSAVRALKEGRVVVFPTETAYGLGADATNAVAARRVSAIKGRETGKTPPLIVASFAMAERYAIFSPALRALARKFWPGPLTIVAPARIPPLFKGGLGGVTRLAPSVIRTDGTIALRVSSNDLARSLSRRLRAPVVATSANRAGKEACYDMECVRVQFSQGLRPDVVLDAGTLPRRKPSTIIRETNGKIEVLRKGSIVIKT